METVVVTISIVFCCLQISLAVLLVLTVTTLNSMAQSSLPKVSYVKAIDIWMLGLLTPQKRYIFNAQRICAVAKL